MTYTRAEAERVIEEQRRLIEFWQAREKVWRERALKLAEFDDDRIERWMREDAHAVVQARQHGHAGYARPDDNEWRHIEQRRLQLDD